MAVEFEPTTVVDISDVTSINNNFQSIKTALQDALSRSGNIPNSMSADIDMNSNDLINVKDVRVSNLYVGGQLVVPSDLVDTSYLPYSQVEISRSTAISQTFPKDLVGIQLGGYSTVGDGGGARYKRVDSEPSHEGKFRSSDRFLSTGEEDVVNGGWWEIVLVGYVNARSFGVATTETAVNNRTYLRNALAFVEGVGGGEVFLPAGSYPFASGSNAMIQASKTVLRGTPKATILIVTGSDDTFKIQDTTSNTELSGCAVWDIIFSESAKTGGNCINGRRLSEFVLGRCKMDQSYKGNEFHNFNNLQLWDTRVVSARDSYHWMLTGGGTGDSPIYGSELRSDVAIFLATESGGTYIDGVSDIIIDGFVHSVDITGHHSVAPGGYGLHAKNTLGASSTPQFIRADGLQVDQPKLECVRIDAGQDHFFNNCILHGSRNNDNFYIANGVKRTTITGGKSTGAALSGIYDLGDMTTISTVACHGNSSEQYNGTYNVSYGIRLGANSTNAIVTGNICGDPSTSTYQNAGIRVESGADDYIVALNNVFNNVTAGVSNASSQDSGRRVFLNMGADNSETIFWHDHAGTTTLKVTNQNTGPSVAARLVADTGTASSSVTVQSVNNSGSPYGQIEFGSAISNCYYDVNNHIFRDGSSNEVFRVQSNKAVRFQPVSGLTSGNTASGDMWIDSSTSDVKVNLGGTVYTLTKT